MTIWRRDGTFVMEKRHSKSCKVSFILTFPFPNFPFQPTLHILTHNMNTVRYRFTFKAAHFNKGKTLKLK